MITHSEMVRLARNWLWAMQPVDGAPRPAVICTEASSTRSSEQPDVFGVAPDGRTYLIECKVSRADFLSDKNKPHRSSELHLGSHRWFCAPSGIIQPHELPERWGLLQIVNRKLVERISASEQSDVDREAELSIMVSILRNVWKGGRVRGTGLRSYSRSKSADKWVWDTPLAPELDEHYPKFNGTVGVEQDQNQDRDRK